MPTAKNVSFTDPYSAEYADLARQKAMADMLSKQAGEPLKTDRMAGGYVIPVGKGEVWGKVAQSALAAYLGYKTNKAETELRDKVKTGNAKDVTDFMGALRGTPAKSEPFQADTFDATDKPFGEAYNPDRQQELTQGGAMSTETAAVAGDKQKAMAIALGAGNPAVQGAGNALLADMLKGQDPYSLSPGQVRFDSNNQPVATAQPKAPDMSSVGKLISERDQLPLNDPRRQLYDQAIEKAATHAPSAQMNNYGSPVAGVGPDGKPVFFQTNKGGGAPSVVPGITPAPKIPEPPTGEERNASGYLGRMQASEKLIGGLAGGEPTEKTSVAGSVPFVGDYAQRKVMTDKQQQFKQATDDWIRAKLRKESGAVIGDIEMKREYQTYFPQPGDRDEVKKQKAQARKQAEEQMKTSAGRAYKKTIDDLWE